MKQSNPKLDFVIQAKANYRDIARAKTWEEKIESIVRMRNASKMAKQSMSLMPRKAKA
jgi:hypothetical protein